MNPSTAAPRAEAATLTLYGHPFSRAHRCMWMLKELGVPFDHVPTAFTDGSTRSPDFLAINPNGRVPALIDGNQVLVESLSINLHLARKFGGPLAPAGLTEEALAVQWSLWAATEVEKPLLLVAANLTLFAPEARNPDELAMALRRLDRPFKVLDAHLADRAHVMADRFTVADINVASMLTLVPIAAVPITQYPHMARWLDAALERPAAADWKPIRFRVPRPGSALGVLEMFM